MQGRGILSRILDRIVAKLQIDNDLRDTKFREKQKRVFDEIFRVCMAYVEDELRYMILDDRWNHYSAAVFLQKKGFKH